MLIKRTPNVKRYTATMQVPITTKDIKIVDLNKRVGNAIVESCFCIGNDVGVERSRSINKIVNFVFEGPRIKAEKRGSLT